MILNGKKYLKRHKFRDFCVHGVDVDQTDGPENLEKLWPENFADFLTSIRHLFTKFFFFTYFLTLFLWKNNFLKKKFAQLFDYCRVQTCVISWPCFFQRHIYVSFRISIFLLIKLWLNITRWNALNFQVLHTRFNYQCLSSSEYIYNIHWFLDKIYPGITPSIWQFPTDEYILYISFCNLFINDYTREIFCCELCIIDTLMVNEYKVNYIGVNIAGIWNCNIIIMVIFVNFVKRTGTGNLNVCV